MFKGIQQSLKFNILETHRVDTYDDKFKVQKLTELTLLTTQSPVEGSWTWAVTMQAPHPAWNTRKCKSWWSNKKVLILLTNLLKHKKCKSWWNIFKKGFNTVNISLEIQTYSSHYFQIKKVSTVLKYLLKPSWWIILLKVFLNSLENTKKWLSYC